MNIFEKVFYKTLVIAYYRKNIYFFFGILLLAFGFLRVQEHITLSKQIISSPYLLMFVLIIWFLYIFKTSLFVSRSLALPANRFLFNGKLLALKNRFWIGLKVHFLLSLPVNLYAIFMIFVTWRNDILITQLIIIVYLVIALIAKSFLFIHQLNQYPQFDNVKLKGNFRSKMIFFGKYGFFLRYLLKKDPVLLLLTKLGSFLIIWFSVWLFPTDEYDYRFFAIMILLISATHLEVLKQYIYFWERQMMIYRNLPLSLFQFLIIPLGSHSILLIPEILILLLRLNDYLSIWMLLNCVLFLLSLLLVLNLSKYVWLGSEERRLQVYFFSLVFVFVLIMFKVPIILLSMLSIVLSSYIILKLWPNYEQLYSDNGR
jgi:hypothetical protein